MNPSSRCHSAFGLVIGLAALLAPASLCAVETAPQSSPTPAASNPVQSAQPTSPSGPQPVKTYSLPDFLTIVMSRSPGIQSAILQAKAADYKAKAVRASYLPKLRAIGQTGYVNGTGLSPLADLSNNQNQVKGFVDGGGGTLDFPLYEEGTFLGINTPPKAEVYYAMKSEADNQALLTRDQIRLDSITAYFLAVQETRKGRLLAQEVGILTKQAQIAEIEYNHQIISKDEFDNSRLQLEQAQEDLVQSQWQAAHSFVVVASLLGVNDATSIHLPGDQPIPASLPPFDVVLTHVLESNPALMQQIAALKQANAQHSFELTKMQPTAQIKNSYTWGDDYNPPGHDQWLSRLQVSIPLFDGGENYYNVRSATEQVESQKQLLYQTKLNLESDLHQAYDAAQNLHRYYLQNRVTMGQRKIAMEKQEVLSNYGQAQASEYLSSQLDYINSSLAVEDSYYSMMVAFAQLDKAGSYTGSVPIIGGQLSAMGNAPALDTIQPPKSGSD